MPCVEESLSLLYFPHPVYCLTGSVLLWYAHSTVQGIIAHSLQFLHWRLKGHRVACNSLYAACLCALGYTVSATVVSSICPHAVTFWNQFCLQIFLAAWPVSRIFQWKGNNFVCTHYILSFCSMSCIITYRHGVVAILLLLTPWEGSLDRTEGDSSSVLAMDSAGPVREWGLGAP